MKTTYPHAHYLAENSLELDAANITDVQSRAEAAQAELVRIEAEVVKAETRVQAAEPEARRRQQAYKEVQARVKALRAAHADPALVKAASRQGDELKTQKTAAEELLKSEKEGVKTARTQLKAADRTAKVASKHAVGLENATASVGGLKRAVCDPGRLCLFCGRPVGGVAYRPKNALDSLAFFLPLQGMPVPPGAAHVACGTCAKVQARWTTTGYQPKGFYLLKAHQPPLIGGLTERLSAPTAWQWLHSMLFEPEAFLLVLTSPADKKNLSAGFAITPAGSPFMKMLTGFAGTVPVVAVANRGRVWDVMRLVAAELARISVEKPTGRRDPNQAYATLAGSWKAGFVYANRASPLLTALADGEHADVLAIAKALLPRVPWTSPEETNQTEVDDECP